VRRAAIVLTALAVLAVALAVGIVPRIQRRDELRAAARSVESSVPTVPVMTPERAPATTDLLLPGSIQAIQESAIYARVDGYLKRRLVDIGSRVEAGQVLAEIDTPELDQQLAQAEATLSQVRAALAQAQASLVQARAQVQHNRSTLEYNRTNLGRWRELRSRDLVAQQDVDDRQVAVDSSHADVQAAEANVESIQANVVAASANVTANEANVRRLRDLQAFQKVRAPFAGLITVRNVDAGALIAAGSGANTTPMFRLAGIDSLRIFVNVPQTFITAIAPGLDAQIVVREFPNRPFRASVATTAGALDPASRTLLTEVRMRNDGHVLRPGMYAEVAFHVTRASSPLLVPASAIIVRASGPQVATVGPDKKLVLRRVDLGRDFGAHIEVVGGLSERETLVTAPPDDARDGTLVNPVPAKSRRPGT
jgi:RND family efflux transporter MFP subunit